MLEYNLHTFFSFRTIPQFKLSHQHKKKQDFSVCKTTEDRENMLKNQSETLKMLPFCQPNYHSSHY